MRPLLAQSSPVNLFDTFFGSNPIRSRANTPGGIISTLLPNVLTIAGVVFLFMILFGGISMVIGAGRQSSPQEAAKAKAALTSGIVGFLLVVSAYFILQMISVIFGVDFANPTL